MDNIKFNNRAWFFSFNNALLIQIFECNML